MGNQGTDGRGAPRPAGHRVVAPSLPQRFRTQSSWASSFFLTFPVAVIGKLSTMRISGTL